MANRRELSQTFLYGGGQSVLFFVAYYFYVLLRIGPHLIHQRLFSLQLDFSRSWSHFALLSAQCGGLVRYAAGHLFQYYEYAWVGALAITAVAAALTAVTGTLLSGSRTSWWRTARYAPAVGLLVLFARYENPMAFALGLLVAVSAVALYAGLRREEQWLRLATFLALSPVVFHLAGGLCCAGYAALCGVVELRARRLRLSIVCLAAAAVVGAVVAWSPGSFGIDDILGRPSYLVGDTPPSTSLFVVDGRPTLLTVATALGVFYLGVLLLRWSASGRAAPPSPKAVAALRRGRATGKRSRASRRGRRRAEAAEATRPPRVTWLRGVGVRWTVQVVAVLAVAGVAAAYGFNGEKRLWLRLGYAFSHRMWPDILELSARIPDEKYNPLLAHDVNRALYHTGQLPQAMFSYRQSPYGLSLILFKSRMDLNAFNPELYHRLADTMYELGRMNDAEHWAHELLQLQGDHPRTLRLLAKINLVKGELPAARVFLGYLAARRNDLGSEAWARERLHELNTRGDVDDEDILRLRGCWQIRDSMRPKRSEESDLRELLEANPRNRMAFEYLMASYLLTCQVGKVAENVGRLDDFDYARIPRCYEQAILLYEKSSGTKVHLGGRHISPETVGLFEEIGRTMSVYGRARQAEALDMMKRRYGSTYFSYYAHFITRMARAMKEDK